MRKYTNQAGVPLSLALFLATDTYDHEEHTISATALLKPIRQLILAQRLPPAEALVDIMGLLKSRMGNAVHDGIERSWLNGYEKAMTALGYPKRVIERIVVNPAPDADLTDRIPVYLEQRSYREIRGVTVSGKFDFVAEGMVEDFKNTSTFTWINGTKDDDYILQGSIYRWLNPKIVTADQMRINFLFWDWQAVRAKTDPNYPAQPVMAKTFPLLSLAETEAFIVRKLDQLERFQDVAEPDLPLCSDSELWRKAPQYKYYKNPKNTARSTKNFDNLHDANARLAADGHVGVVVEKPGEVVACKYCPAFPICSQKDQLIADGSLKL